MSNDSNVASIYSTSHGRKSWADSRLFSVANLCKVSIELPN